MTVLLVLMTLILFLATDQIVQRVRQARAARAMEPLSSGVEETIPEGIAFAVNHLWTREERGILTVGADGFLAGIAGTLESILLPALETRVVPASAGVVFRHAGREIRLAIPVPGAVTEVNESLAKNPGLLASDPYGAGWLVKVRRLDNSIAPLRTIPRRDVPTWLSDQAARAKDFFAARLPQPLLMQDGGVPVRGLLKEFPAEVWKEFQDNFLPTHTEC
jgi:glycine cleavage system H protein